jgi:hypothetical protein
VIAGVKSICAIYVSDEEVIDFALRLPGFGVIPGITIPILSYWDGQPLR